MLWWVGAVGAAWERGEGNGRGRGKPAEADSKAMDDVGLVEVVEGGEVVRGAEVLGVDGVNGFGWEGDVLAARVPGRQAGNCEGEAGSEARRAQSRGLQ